MSPKVDSRASEPARSAWSRDVRPNTSGVTYSRRSYYYDREFSDSIIPPAGEFIQICPAPARLAENLQVRGGVRGRQFQSTAAVVVAKRPVELRAFEDPFTRGRVLQSAAPASASDSDDEEDGGGDIIPNSAAAAAIEIRDYVPIKPTTQTQAPPPPLPHHYQARNAVTTAAAAAAAALKDSEDGAGLKIAGLDMQTMAQTFVVAMDLAARMTEVYQRFRENEAEGVDEGLLDPYYLETGLPPRYRSPSRASSSRSRSSLTGPRKSATQRPVASSASTSTSLGSVTLDAPQGHAADGNATTAAAAAAAVQTEWLLNPLPPMKRLCYYLVATALFGVLASFGFALWWAHSRKDVSAGFTIGGYLIAVDALVVAVVGIVHRPGCRCWKA